MEFKQVVIDYAIKEVENFVMWAREIDPSLAKSVLGDNISYKTTDVEKLFESLDNSKKNEYQYIVDNKDNIATANRLGILEPSVSMSLGESGYLLKESIKILLDASIEKINIPIMNFSFYTEKLSKTDGFGGGTELGPAIKDLIKENAVKNVSKVRYVLHLTDGDSPQETKPKNS